MSGVYSLVKAAGAVERKMDTVSNNLANVNTTGFKEDQPSFREVLSKAQQVPPESEEERFLSHEYLDQYVGMEKSAVTVDEIGKNFSPGPMQQTDNALDLAINNEGFFTIDTPFGQRFTRNGNFQLNSEGTIVTSDNYPVLGENGPIQVKGQEIFVDYQGRVQVDGQLADRLLTVRFRNQDNLQKLGNSFFAPISSDDVPIPSEEVRVQQGMLEGSNVNTVMEMTRMISANRTYESIQKSLSSVDRMNERAISISRLRG